LAREGRPRVIKASGRREVIMNKNFIKEIVSRGGLVIYPTDTVYGLGCDPFNASAVRKIFEVKRRENKPLPVLARSLEDVKRIAYMNELAKRLAEIFWPGPLTLILRRRPTLPSEVTLGRNTVGVRIPNHEVALSLLEIVGGLFIGTSANISGAPSPRTANDAIAQLNGSVDLVIDSGPSPIGVPSTCIDLTTKPPRIIRLGALSISRIRNILREVMV